MAETIEESYETAVTRKVVRTSLKIEEKSSSTKTTTMTTPAKLYGRELSTYDEVDVDELLSKLTQEELTMLAKEVDPDDNFLPPSQRTNYECEKDPTGPLNRKKLIEHINKQALETPDRPEVKPYVAGVVRGKKWIPPPQAEKLRDAEEQIAIDLGDEYEGALSGATQEEIIDLAAILGFHSMMNQDQYHASLLNKGQPVGLGWDGITKATKPKVYPMDPPNDTDPDDTLSRIAANDQTLTDLNWNNIKNISDEKFEKLFNGLKTNSHLETLCLVNVGLTDRTAAGLAAALEVNSTLRVVNVETNFISPAGVVALVRALLATSAVEEFRASNQRSQVLGNKIEMEISSLVEQNPTLLRLGLHLEYSDARHRVASHLQRNIDRSTYTSRADVLLDVCRAKMLESKDCRTNKGSRASASLSLRLPRGRPPAVGVDSSFFNLTPPSAEQTTPTTDTQPITEAVEQSLTIPARSPAESESSDRPVTPEQTATFQLPAPTETREQTDVQPEVQQNGVSETPVYPDRVVPVEVEQTEPQTESEVKRETERFVLAERPDTNPNPHSTPATSESEQRLEQ